MRKRVNTSDDAELIDRETFYKYVSCGRQSADMLAKEAGAERRIGRRIFILSSVKLCEGAFFKLNGSVMSG